MHPYPAARTCAVATHPETDHCYGTSILQFHAPPAQNKRGAEQLLVPISWEHILVIIVGFVPNSREAYPVPRDSYNIQLHSVTGGEHCRLLDVRK